MAGYNGWKNRQTWNVALWLGNDEPLYRRSLAVARSYRTLSAAVEAVRDLCGEVWPTGYTPDGDSLRGVDWREVVRPMRED